MTLPPKSTSPLPAKYTRRGPLTDEQIEAIDRHTKVGYKALARLVNASEAAVYKYRKLKQAA